ncbi:thiol-disulfide oxidoreductase DCC family protein [Maribacter sp. PR1]|uniref:Thiol-disulfide oxidoreductase DCC family protein n=1 Tax=Maribacter cobaltidurans TaxID=1178778 RepID=A0ABU7ISL0_9FLAO|nr:MULTISPECIES: thiol-disulfide oxidoreductase DCC family protein [Maribacter]MDC6388387.1 thiol-disulfide oxidoreductase DCC family protein [Maribacter sp. PR1]MEE1975776.1 thiol-disulfide oxidoreductase DCC family protein [Maribacter cobaltidurans]
MKEPKKIILFDGVCNVCNGFVQFIIKRDKEDLFRFASLQSEIAQKLLSERTIDTQKIDSVVLIEPGVAYYLKSDAALEIGKELKGYRTLSKILGLIPSSLRNIVYDIIARNRYSWYGKKDECMIPTPEIKSKFL